MKTMQLPAVERIKELLNYFPETGVFEWKTITSKEASMIKLPEPVAYLHYPKKKQEIKALSFLKEPAASQIARGFVSDGLHSETQLKQAVRDALTLAATQCKALDNDENSDDYRQGAIWCGERIRALIKEIP